MAPQQEKENYKDHILSPHTQMGRHSQVKQLIVVEHLLHTKAFGSIVPLIISTLPTVH